MDITPMIDVTFLLLIFFMVTSTMENPDALKIPEARSGLGVDTQKAAVITIFSGEDAPEIFLADGVRENGPVDVSEVGAYVQSQGQKTVIIKADRDVPSGFVEDVARAANESGEDLMFFVGVEDKQN
jgi:biopolymer transport protein ExbD/biopolymer transport protein TolR